MIESRKPRESVSIPEEDIRRKAKEDTADVSRRALLKFAAGGGPHKPLPESGNGRAPPRRDHSFSGGNDCHDRTPHRHAVRGILQKLRCAHQSPVPARWHVRHSHTPDASTRQRPKESSIGSVGRGGKTAGDGEAYRIGRERE